MAFRARRGPPGGVGLLGWGVGGLIATRALEASPPYGAACVICAPIGSTASQLEYLLDLSRLFELYFPGVLPGETVPTLDAPTQAHVVRLLNGAPETTLRLLRTAGAPGIGLRASGVGRNSSSPVASALRLLREAQAWRAQQRAAFGGRAYANLHAAYPALGLEGGSAAASVEDELVSKVVPREAADAGAVAALREHFETRGSLRAPLVAVHADGALVAPYWHEQLYARKANMQGAAALHSVIRANATAADCTLAPALVSRAFSQLGSHLKPTTTVSRSPTRRPSGWAPWGTLTPGEPYPGAASRSPPIVGGGGGGALRHGALRFGPPATVGEDYYASGFRGFGDGRHALGKAEGGWYATSDGGKTWGKATLTDGGRHVEGDLHAAVLSSDGRTMHNLGASLNLNPNGSYYAFNASTADYFSVRDDLPRAFAASARPTPVSFRGLPQPATCGDPKRPGLFGCPVRTGGGGLVRLADGTLVMSVIVYWGPPRASPDPAVAHSATSVVAYRATDRLGLSWEYAGIILDAASAPQSEEGPNENDLALMPDGRILCVLRLDAGDGVRSQPYRPYVYSMSSDGGRTWSAAVPLGEGVGCARPRLLALGKRSLLLSGGRRSPTDRDILLWHNAAGDGATWEAHSISFVHNQLEPNASLHFDAKLNASANASSPRESTSYTSLVATGERSGFIVYARHKPPGADVAFAMPFWLDNGELVERAVP